MRQETVKVKVSKLTGEMTIDNDGFIGEGCSVIEEIERNMGSVTETKDKEERFQYELPNPNPLNRG